MRKTLIQETAKKLKNLGINSIAFKDAKKIPNLLYKKKFGIVEKNGYGKFEFRSNNVKFINLRKGKSKFTHVLHKNGEKLDLKLPKHPKIVIDLSLWDYHTEEEKKSLIDQLILSASKAREYFDEEIISINNAPKTVKEYLEKLNFNFKFKKMKKVDVLLDPHADKELKKIKANKTYCIGGIVDKSQRIRTYELGIKYKKRRSIKLFGDVLGVSDRINAISAILIDGYVFNSINYAILKNTTKKFLVARIKKDLKEKKITELKKLIRKYNLKINEIKKLYML